MTFAKLFNLSNNRQVLVTIYRYDDSSTTQWDITQRTNINTVDITSTQKEEGLESAKKILSEYSEKDAEAFWIQMKMEMDYFEGTYYNLHKTICKN